MKQKTGILLINLGTPDSPSVGDVRTYLREFLMDPYVIDIPLWKRFLLVNFIIAPFRAPKSAKLYKEIWTKDGSPLLIHTRNLATRLEETLGESHQVKWAMRYQHPGIGETITQWKELHDLSELVVIPLYPQPASSSTTSTIELVRRIFKKYSLKIPVRIVDKFYDHPSYLDAVAASASGISFAEYDHILFSFHGVPERHILKDDHSGVCRINDSCCGQISEKNEKCYRAACFHTAREVAKRLRIPDNGFTVCFQSRLGSDPWVQPYTDKVIEEMGRKGNKKLLVFSPAFVADCLETIYEIGVEYQELFQQFGGEKVTLVPGLNDRPEWVQTVAELALQSEQQPA
ncbi:MAG: ferrochelatase [Flavobacteriales bacterium]|nr:ferrochelatase [Flavobacteriales bacterium]